MIMELAKCYRILSLLIGDNFLPSSFWIVEVQFKHFYYILIIQIVHIADFVVKINTAEKLY